MNAKILVITAALAALLGAPVAAYARGGHGGHGYGFHGHVAHGYGFHHGHDFGAWRGGRWHHAWHGGRQGWWWVVGPSWFFYSQPVYPYPRYDGPLYSYPRPYPSTILSEREAPPLLGPAPAQNWYYCDDAKGYYPYVKSCRSEWRAVPVTPTAEGPGE